MIQDFHSLDRMDTLCKPAPGALSTTMFPMSRDSPAMRAVTCERPLWRDKMRRVQVLSARPKVPLIVIAFTFFGIDSSGATF